MSSGCWVSVSQAAEFFQVSNSTIRKWADAGRIPCQRTPTKQRKIQLPDQRGAIEIERDNFVYVRVSSYKQKADLERQANFLLTQFPEHDVVKDIGSGLNFKRHGLVALLERVESDSVGEIVVASRDRLCRFGFELIEWICAQHGTKIVVLEQNDASPEEELAAELFEFVKVFCDRRTGARRYNHKKSKDCTATETASEEDTEQVGSS